MISLEKKQIEILKKIQKFFLKFKNLRENISYFDLLYLCPYGQSRGTAKVLSFFNKSLSIKILIISIVKDIYKLLKIGKFHYISARKTESYKTLIINWASIKDFDKNGNFYDKHFNINSSKCENVHWLLIYSSSNFPEKISKNISLIFNQKKKFNIQLILQIIYNFFSKKKKLKFFFQEFTYMTQLANFLGEIIPNLIDDKILKVLTPYEGQPFQNSVYKEVNNLNKKIKTVGFIHSYPIGLPSNLFKRDGHPKQLIVSSLSQKFCMTKHLNWSEKDIKILPSARLLKKNNFKMENKIFLPIQFSDPGLIIFTLKSLIFKEKLNLKNIQIRNHPSCSKSPKHIKLIKSLKEVVKKFSLSKKKIRNVSIFIGPTGSVIEALARNVKVYHICEIPELESYHKKIWKYIESFEIDNNLFEYKLIGKNKLINFGKHLDLYKKYFY